MKRTILLTLSLFLCFGNIAMTSCNQTFNDESSLPSAEETSTPTPARLRIGTYNIANGREINWDFKLIAEDIKNNNLDIVGLQEVDRFCNRSKKIDTVARLKEYTGWEYCAYFKCIDHDGGEYGTAILSKYPIIETNEIELNDGKTVERRLLTCAKIDVNGKIINFFNTHLTIASADVRKKEFQTVASKVVNVENSILTGDFNVSSYAEYDCLKPLSFVNNPETSYITYPENERRIDNICYSEQFTLVENSHGIYQQNHSDHVLLYAEFEYYPDN